MRDFVVVGLGQLGELYAGGALRAGWRVQAVRRGDDPRRVIDTHPGAPVLVSVGEPDLMAVLSAIPTERRPDVILLQNDLFPSDWQHFVDAPTVAVVWLNRKKGAPPQVARPTTLYGRHAAAMVEVHTRLDLSAEVLPDDGALGRELVAKFAFIVAVNGLGVAEDRTVGEWRRRDPDTVARLVDEGLRLGIARLGRPIDEASARRAIDEAMAALEDMPVRGRSAPTRVQRALSLARELSVPMPGLSALAPSEPAR